MKKFSVRIWLVLASMVFQWVPAQANDFSRALDILNKVQRSLPPSQRAPTPVPAPPPYWPSQPSSEPSSPATLPPASRSSRRVAEQEPPPGQYVITTHTRSRLQPGERIEHDLSQPPKGHPQWTASFENFTPPDATTAYADGPRAVVMQYGNSLLRYKRVLSNPYIPTERADVGNPNWAISPYYAQGFFSQIDGFSCRPDGTLYVQGNVGVAADMHRGRAWARGIWRVTPEGQMLAHEVFPGSQYMKGGKHTCSTRTCGLPPYAPLERALAAGSLDWVQDKHGNVWGVRGNVYRGRSDAQCFVRRFNVDGTDTEIQSHADLCEVPAGYNRDFLNPPYDIVYDPSRDEVVYSAGKGGGNTDGSWALFRATQDGKVTELLRNWMHADNNQFGPNPPGKTRKASNQVRESWNRIVGLAYHRASGAVWFEVSVFSEHNYPSRMYEIRESFRTLKRLPYNSPGQIAAAHVFGRDPKDGTEFFGDDQKLSPDETNFTVRSNMLGDRPCYDDAGNRYFQTGMSVRKMDAQGRLSTWVK